jgi:hydrogenase maturation factor
MALASSLRIRADLGSVLWFEPGRELCAALGADPLATLASGSLLAAFPADRTNAVLRALARHGHAAARIGTAETGSGVCDAEDRPLAWPSRDEVARVLSGGREIGVGPDPRPRPAFPDRGVRGGHDRDDGLDRI